MSARKRTLVPVGAFVRALVLSPLLVLTASVGHLAHAQEAGAEAGSWNVRLGNVTIGPSLVLTTAHDTNVLRTAEVDNVASFEFVAIPQANLAYPVAHYDFTFTGAAEYAYTPNERSDKKDVINNFVEAHFGSDSTVFRPRITVHRLSTYARSEVELGQKSQRNERLVTAGLDWVPGRLSVRAGYQDVRTRFATDEFYQDVSLALKLNSDFRVPSVGVGYELSPLVGLTSSLEFGDYNFTLSPERNGRSYKAVGGLTFQAPGALIGSALGGFREYQGDNEPDVQAKTFVADASLAHTRPSSQVTGTFNRDVGFSWDSDQALYLSHQARLNYYQQLPKRLDFELNGELIWVNYIPRASSQELPEGQRRQTFLGALGVRLTPWTRVGVNVERDRSMGNEQWQAWRMTAYLYYGSHRFRKLDRPLPR